MMSEQLNLKQSLIPAIAVLTGLVAGISLIFDITAISSTVLGWAAFLAAVALVAGVVNLASVHFRRVQSEKNKNSAILLGTIFLVLLFAILDVFEVTDNALADIFDAVIFPMEAAFASLLAVLLLLAAIRLLGRVRGILTALFLITVVVVLLTDALMAIQLLPEHILATMQSIRLGIDQVVVAAGVRAILIGVAMATIIISIRILIGWERPYER